MKNKGLFKIFFTPQASFAIGRTAYSVVLEFTLSQCRLGWASFMNSIQIHLIFVDILIDHWRFKSKEIAKNYLKSTNGDIR